MLGLVIGDNDMITGFRLVGVDGIEVTSVDEAKEALEKTLLRSDIAIIIISQAFSTQSPIHEEIDKVRRERRTPVIVEMPGSRSPSDEAHLSALINKTLGFTM
jgi:V/A-type H+-transporting ATPase subunit F